MWVSRWCCRRLCCCGRACWMATVLPLTGPCWSQVSLKAFGRVLRRSTFSVCPAQHCSGGCTQCHAGGLALRRDGLDSGTESRQRQTRAGPARVYLHCHPVGDRWGQFSHVLSGHAGDQCPGPLRHRVGAGAGAVLSHHRRLSYHLGWRVPDQARARRGGSGLWLPLADDISACGPASAVAHHSGGVAAHLHCQLPGVDYCPPPGGCGQQMLGPLLWRYVSSSEMGQASALAVIMAVILLAVGGLARRFVGTRLGPDMALHNVPLSLS